MTKKLVLIGASGHALVVADIIRQQGDYEIVGFLDDVNLDRHGSEFCGAKILGGFDRLSVLRKDGVQDCLIAIGHCPARLRLSKRVNDQGFRLGVAVHPQAIVAPDVSIGDGSVICAGAVINPGVRIGENVIVNTSASVDHECIISDGVHVGPGVHLGGRVQVGQGAWLGIGSIVKDRVDIGAGSILGAGAVLLKNLPASMMAYGIPANVIRNVEDHDF
jgi:UDP-N-acetylbacillosamine N-acetyltransferase